MCGSWFRPPVGWLLFLGLVAGSAVAPAAHASYSGPGAPPIEISSHAATVRGLSVYYELTQRVGAAGDPAVVLIHGLGGSARVWALTAPDLARAGFTVLALDLPGFGRSDVPPAPMSVLEYPEYVVDFLDAVGLGRAAVVGSSMGGYIAWALAANHPERVSALALVDSAGLPLPDPLPKPLQRLKPWVSPSFGQDEGLGALIPGLQWFVGLTETSVITRLISRPFIEEGFIDPTGISPDTYESLHQSFKESRIILLGRLTFEIPPPGWLDLLESIRVPTLIQWGGQDPVIPLGDAYRFAGLIAGSTVQVYPALGHLPMLEAPEVFNEDLATFLDRALRGPRPEPDQPAPPEAEPPPPEPDL